MQVHRIGNEGTAFGAKLVNSSALEKYKAGLNDAQHEIFDRRNKVVEAVQDEKEYIYSVFTQGAVKIASIMEIVKTDGMSFLPRYSGYEENADSLFELLYKEYKEIHSKLNVPQEKEAIKKINAVL